MLVAALVVPEAPALLPGVGGTADPFAALRERMRAEATALQEKGAERLVVVAAGPRTGAWAVDAPSGATRFTSGLVPEGALPTGLEIGRMVLEETVGQGTLELWSVAADAAPPECLALGRSLVHDPGAVALLVLADGPATLSEKAPGHLDERAAPFAEGLRAALASGDAGALAGLDPDLCDALWMRGRPALQVLAGAAGEAPFAGEVAHEGSPYGVQYLIATWARD